MWNWLKRFAATVGDLLTSKKVLTALATGAAGVFIKDPALRDRIVATGVVLIGAQGAADVGKEAVKANKAPAPPAP